MFLAHSHYRGCPHVFGSCEQAEVKAHLGGGVGQALM